jgi:hypothetical protein
VLLELHFESPALNIDANAAPRESVADGTFQSLSVSNFQDRLKGSWQVGTVIV